MKQLIFVFLLFANFAAIGQGRKPKLQVKQGERLLYYVENNSGNNQFLIPFVESELRLLKDNHDTEGHYLLSDVNSLNLYLSGDKTTKKLSRAITLFNKNYTPFKNNKNEAREDTLIRNSLKDRDWFLKININTLNNLLEYQFVLFKVIRDKGNPLPLLELTNYRATSVFVDPNSDDYKMNLTAAIRHVITEGNEAPQPYLTYQNKITDDTIYAASGHIVLGANAVDIDSAPNELNYNWFLSQRGSGFKLERPGKNFEYDINGGCTLQLELTVTDDITPKTRDYVLVVSQSPGINIIPPYNTKNNDFSNGSFHLYSFHKTFMPNDFVGFINIHPKRDTSIFQPEQNEGWPLLIPEVRIISSVPERENLSVSAIKYALSEDSLARYKESLIKDIGSGEGLVQLSDEWSSFKLIAYPVTTYKNASGYYVHSYAIYQHGGNSFEIGVPSKKLFKVVARNHNSQNSEIFRVNFDKVSRFSAYFNESYYYGLKSIDDSKINHRLGLFFLGLGAECRIIPAISLDGSLGYVTADASHIDANLTTDSYYFKISANLCVINYRDKMRLSFVVSELHRPGFNYILDTTKTKVALNQVKYLTRPGIGLLFEPSPYNTYHFEQFSFSAFFSFYPQTPTANGNGIEAGAKLKIYLKKKA